MSRSHRLARRGVFLALALVVLAPRGAAAARAQRQESSRSFDRTIASTSGQSLRVDHRHGDVRITTHPGRELRVQATIRASASSQKEADELLGGIDIEITDTAAAIAVRTRYPEQNWWRSRRNLSYSVDYTLLMPDQMPLSVRNSFGNVSVAGLKAEATVVNAHGMLTVADGAGRHTLENSFGSIEVMRMKSDVTITGANGNVNVGTVAGALNVTNRFGRVNAMAVQGPALVANANGQVDLADAGSARVTNSFGAVTVRDVRGALTISNANGAVTAAVVKGMTKVTSSFGPIEVKDVDADATVENSNGGVKLVNVRGAAAVKTSFAPADVAGVAGTLTVTNANGAVSLRDVGGAAEVRGSFGRIDVAGIKAGIRVTSGNSGVRIVDARGPVAVVTSFGPVELRNVEGKIDVRNQNGAIDAAMRGKPGTCHDITLATSFSPIQLQLAEAGYAVTAETSFGKIHSDLPITATGTIGEGRLSGTIGGGGCAMQLINANGDIRIVKLPTVK